MESLRRAILLNNAGVNHLDCGHADNALYSFQCAVVTVRGAMVINADPSMSAALMEPPMPTTTSTTTVSYSFPPQSTINDHVGYQSSTYQASKPNTTGAPEASPITHTPPCPLSPQQQPSSTLLDSLNIGISYIYNRPLLIPTDISIQSVEHLNAVMVTVSAYIIFNFALTCHVVGKHAGKENYLMRSMKLYELTLKVLKCNNSSGVHHEMHAVLECLTLNNLAQMHYDLCDYASTRFYMDSMYALLMTIQRIDIYLEEDELEELMLNLVHLQSPVVAKAA